MAVHACALSLVEPTRRKENDAARDQALSGPSGSRLKVVSIGGQMKCYSYC